MSVTLYGTSTLTNAQVQYKGLELFYSVNSIQLVTRILKIEDDSLRPMATYSINETSNAVVFWIREAIEKNVKSIQIIAKHLGWEIIGQGLDCLINFENIIKERKIELGDSLNLSGLSLSNIPPQIKLFTEITTLDLSNNQLRMLPVEIQCLPKLVEIDLSKNPIELPPWATKMTGVTFKIDTSSVISYPLAQERISQIDV